MAEEKAKKPGAPRAAGRAKPEKAARQAEPEGARESDLTFAEILAEALRQEAPEGLLPEGFAGQCGGGAQVKLAIALAQVRGALSGNTTAAAFVRDTLGEKPAARGKSAGTDEGTSAMGNLEISVRVAE